MQLSLPRPRTFKADFFPGIGGTNDRIPKREGPALQRPAGVHQTAVFPENTVVISLFFQGKILHPLAEGYPTTPCFHKFLLPHTLTGSQYLQIFPGEKNIAAFITATGRTPFTGKTKSL
jgi:hypothetical protein